MPELDVPEDGSRAHKNKNTRIVLDDGTEIAAGTKLEITHLPDNPIMEVGQFLETESDEAETFANLSLVDGESSGVYSMQVGWRELAVQVDAGEAVIRD